MANLSNLSRTKNVNLIAADQYRQFKNEKFYGAYVWSTPTLHIQDLDLIQKVRSIRIYTNECVRCSSMQFYF